MHYEDLTPFTYSEVDDRLRALNVGWLGAGHAFPVAPPKADFIEALRKLVASPVKLYRGRHQCEFCPSPPPESRNGLLWITARDEIMGTGEIHVRGDDGATYVAPVLVRHYVEAHQYAPPAAFVRACLACANGSMPDTSLERTGGR
jgi:hypothetical protein